jgi:hypothetical protein
MDRVTDASDQLQMPTTLDALREFTAAERRVLWRQVQGPDFHGRRDPRVACKQGARSRR